MHTEVPVMRQYNLPSTAYIPKPKLQAIIAALKVYINKYVSPIATVRQISHNSVFAVSFFIHCGNGNFTSTGDTRLQGIFIKWLR